MFILLSAVIAKGQTKQAEDIIPVEPVVEPFNYKDTVLYNSVTLRELPFQGRKEITFRKSNLLDYIFLYSTDQLNINSSNSKFYQLLAISTPDEGINMDSIKTITKFNSRKSAYKAAVDFSNSIVYCNSRNNNYNKLSYSNCVIKEFIMRSDTSKTVSFFDCKFDRDDYIGLSGVCENFEISRCILPDTLNLAGIDTKGNIVIDPSNDGKKVNLIIDKTFPIQNLKWSYSKFNLHFRNVEPERIEYFYREAIEVQKKLGSSPDIEQADIALKDFLVKRGDIFLGFQKFLWNYGYDKVLLLKRLLFSFVLFYILNFLFFRKLILEVYIIENLSTEYTRLKSYRNKKERYLKLPLIVFLYSSIIFFGWKMDVDKFPFKHLFLSLYIFFFYLIGLGLLFYAVGLLLNK
jgi:hypothetical protein